MKFPTTFSEIEANFHSQLCVRCGEGPLKYEHPWMCDGEGGRKCYDEYMKWAGDYGVDKEKVCMWNKQSKRTVELPLAIDSLKLNEDNDSCWHCGKYTEGRKLCWENCFLEFQEWFQGRFCSKAKFDITETLMLKWNQQCRPRGNNMPISNKAYLQNMENLQCLHCGDPLDPENFEWMCDGNQVGGKNCWKSLVTHMDWSPEDLNSDLILRRGDVLKWNKSFYPVLFPTNRKKVTQNFKNQHCIHCGNKKCWIDQSKPYFWMCSKSNGDKEDCQRLFQEWYFSCHDSVYALTSLKEIIEWNKECKKLYNADIKNAEIGHLAYPLTVEGVMCNIKNKHCCHCGCYMTKDNEKIVCEGCWDLFRMEGISDGETLTPEIAAQWNRLYTDSLCTDSKSLYNLRDREAIGLPQKYKFSGIVLDY